MLSMNKSAYRRRERSDKGKPHKSQLSPQYLSYLAREHGARRSARLSEGEVLAILSHPCDTCGDVATYVRGRIGYCPLCDRHMGLGTDAEVIAWVRSVAQYRL